jgi:hypothetical protein
MLARTIALTALFVLGFGVTATAGGVDLSPDESGERIAVTKDGKVAYLPAKRVNIGANQVGGGHCRYIKRANNGDLYVTGPNLGNRMFRSTDHGHSWASWELNVDNMEFLSALAILNDDTFLIVYMPPPRSAHKEMWIARSVDYGKTWDAHRMELELSPFKYVMGWNADMIQLADRTIFLTLDVRMSENAVHDEAGTPLPPHLRGGFLYVYRSRDHGETWGDRSRIPDVGGEVHLLALPSGKLMAAVRKQRWYRMPGDPASVLELKRRYGYTPLVGGGLIEDGEDANRMKNMFVSESYDDGYTWVNAQQVSNFMQCSGDMTYLKDGTLVLQYLHRYSGGPMADVSIRARVSYDDGQTWEPEEYILSDGENYPGSIAAADGGVITMCPHRGQIQAVLWRPLPKDKPELAYRDIPANNVDVLASDSAVQHDEIPVLHDDGGTTQRLVTRVNLLPPPAGARHSPIHYSRNSAAIDRSLSGDIYCTGNVLGQVMLRSSDNGLTWNSSDLAIAGWGSLVAFKILSDDTFVALFEPVGNPHRVLYLGRSSDRGKTWSVQKAALESAPFTHVSGKGHNLVELPDGTLLVALRLWRGQSDADKEAPEGPREARTFVLRSMDRGKTWSHPAEVCGLAGQTRILRLASGKLLACVFKLNVGVVNKLFLAESNDNGHTWTNKREVIGHRQPGGANLTQIADGTVVLEYLYDTAPGKSPHSTWYYIEGVRAVVSHDEGATWEKDVYVLGRQTPPGEEPTGQGAYLSDSVTLEDGSLLTTCLNHSGRGMQFQAVTWRPVPQK